MIALVEGSNRQKIPNEIALGILLTVMTVTFIIVVVSLPLIGHFLHIEISPILLVALLVLLDSNHHRRLIASYWNCRDEQSAQSQCDCQIRQGG